MYMMYKYCRCGKKIEYSLNMCDECKAKEDSRVKERYRDYNRRRTDKAEQSFYNSREWTQIRDRVRTRDNGICRLCWSKEIFQLGEIVHHLVEVKEDFNKKLELTNLICLCNCCHREVHREYKKNKVSKNKMQERLKELIKE